VYRALFALVFARLDPEHVHHLVSRVIRAAGVLAPVLRPFFRPPPGSPVRTLGLEFESPFGVAAGFDKEGLMIRGLHALGFGHIEVGTVTAIPQPGNERPRLFRLIEDRALLNRMGFNNAGASAVRTRLARARAHRIRPIIGANIGKSRVVDVEDAIEDYRRSARELAPVADYLVVNVSSPNTPGLRGLQELDRLAPLLEAVLAEAAGVPVLVKIAPDLSDEQAERIALLAVRLGLAGIVATNTTLSREGLRTPAPAVADMGAGGVSGPPVAARALELVRALRAIVPNDFCIIAAGGIETAADALERLEAGATLVQGYTGFIYAGPFWARSVTRGMARLRARGTARA
jgi:dihydroorotate dehydrogenase